MTGRALLVELAVQQARTLALTLEALNVTQDLLPPCVHPEGKVTTRGTMGRMSRFCTMCDHELPGSSPDTIKEGST